jgi:UDP-galactose transporter B1
MLMQPSKRAGDGGSSSLYGIALLTINLLIDGATNSTQDQVFRKHKISGSSMMVYLNMISFALMTGYLLIGAYIPVESLATNELENALRLSLAHPQLAYDIALFAICGALGQCFIFYTLETFGSLLLVYSVYNLAR